MLSRRTFVQSLGAASFAAALPVGAGSTSPPEPLPRRAIPGTDESLAIVGLGNSAFYESDMASSRQLIEVFLQHGGS